MRPRILFARLVKRSPRLVWWSARIFNQVRGIGVEHVSLGRGRAVGARVTTGDLSLRVLLVKFGRKTREILIGAPGADTQPEFWVTPVDFLQEIFNKFCPDAPDTTESVGPFEKVPEENDTRTPPKYRKRDLEPSRLFPVYYHCPVCGADFEKYYKQIWGASTSENRVSRVCRGCVAGRKKDTPSSAERAKKWRQQYPERVKNYKMAHGGADFTLGEWLSKVESKCHFCRCPLRGDAGERDPAALVRHKLIPLAEGGRDSLDNSVPCCRSCHNSKAGARRNKTEILA